MTKRVLLVEDEALVAWGLEVLIRGMGHEIVGVAVSAEEALVIAASLPPDIALVDRRLVDGATGLELSEALERLYGTVVVAVTADADTVVAGRQGVRRVVSKPYTDDIMREAVIWAAGQCRCGAGREIGDHR